MRVVTYARVSTEEQGESGAGLEAQRKATRDEALRRGWEWNNNHDYYDVASGKTLERPALEQALDYLAGASRSRFYEGDLVLMVAKLDRLTRSIGDFSDLLERSRQEGWSIVALDLGVDTTTPTGELVANVMMSVAQWERRIIGQRTKEALAVRREQGVVLGRPVEVDPAIADRIVRLRTDEALSYAAIADVLNGLSIPSPRGSRWSPATVLRIYQRHARREGTA